MEKNTTSETNRDWTPIFVNQFVTQATREKISEFSQQDSNLWPSAYQSDALFFGVCYPLLNWTELNWTGTFIVLQKHPNETQSCYGSGKN